MEIGNNNGAMKEIYTQLLDFSLLCSDVDWCEGTTCSLHISSDKCLLQQHVLMLNTCYCIDK